MPLDAAQREALAFDLPPLSSRRGLIKATALADAPAEVELYGEVGWEITARGVRDVLKPLAGRDITLRVNSPGGNVFEGFAIYNLLARHDGQVTLVVEALAASIAAFFAMAASTVVMSRASFMMIHNSSGLTFGDRNAHADTQKVLERIDALQRQVFAERSGLSDDEISAMLDAETWFTAEEAVERGFADRIEGDAIDPVAKGRLTPRAAALLSQFGKLPTPVQAWASAVSPTTPPAPPAEPKEAPMPQDNPAPQPPANPTSAPNPAPAAPPVIPPQAKAAPPVIPPQAKAASLGDLKQLVARSNGRLNSDWVVAQMEAGATLDQARDAMIDAMAAAQPPRGQPGAPDGGRDPATAFQAMAAALAVRGGVKRPEIVAAAKPYQGATLRDLAYEALTLQGRRPASWVQPDELFRHAFSASATVGMHTTSDFARMFNEASEIIVLGAYEAASSEWRKVARTFNVDDFKEKPIGGGWDVDDLELVTEHGEITYGTISRALGKVKMQTFAKGFAFSRQAIINNDLEEFTGQSAAYGQMVARSLSGRVWRIFREGGSTILMPDGKPLFHADHGNLAASGGPIDETTLAAAEMALMKQASVPGKPLGIVAKRLVVGIGRRHEALRFVAQEKFQDGARNLYFGMEVVYEPTFPEKGWALIADPDVRPVIAVPLLGGRETPMVDTEASFETYGVKVRIGLDYEATPIDWNGIYFNPGPA